MSEKGFNFLPYFSRSETVGDNGETYPGTAEISQDQMQNYGNGINMQPGEMPYNTEVFFDPIENRSFIVRVFKSILGKN